MALSERDRIKKVYEHYGASDYYERIWYQKTPGNIFLRDATHAHIATVLNRHGLAHLRNLRILETGCGSGPVLSHLVRLGASEKWISGIDLLEERLRAARKALPAGSFQLADAASLPYRDHAFDLVLQFTMLSSVLDPDKRSTIAREMLRVLKPRGTILSFDVRCRNPQNPNTRPVSKRELESDFRGCHVICYPVILIPQLARLLAPLSLGFCRLLERIPILRSHYLSVIQKD